MPYAPDRLINVAVNRVLPYVQAQTGYQFDMDSLSLRAVPEGEFYQTEVRDSIETLRAEGIDTARTSYALKLKASADNPTRLFMLNNLVGADYDDYYGRINFNWPNEGLPIEFLYGRAAHELTHRGQHITYPDFFAYKRKARLLTIERQEAGNDLKLANLQTILIKSFLEEDAYRVFPRLPSQFQYRAPFTWKQTLASLIALPFIRGYSAPIKAWQAKELSLEDRVVIFQNPDRVIEFFDSTLTPTQLVLGDKIFQYLRDFS